MKSLVSRSIDSLMLSFVPDGGALDLTNLFKQRQRFTSLPGPAEAAAAYQTLVAHSGCLIEIINDDVHRLRQRLRIKRWEILCGIAAELPGKLHVRSDHGRPRRHGFEKGLAESLHHGRQDKDRGMRIEPNKQ